MMWVVLSVLATVAMAGSLLINQYMKVNGFELAVTAKAFLGLAFLPLCFYVGWPGDPLFYVFVLATAPLAIWGDKLLFGLSADYGGGVVSRLLPLHVLLIFFIWLGINPDYALGFLGRPFILGGIFVCLLSTVYFSGRMRKCRVSMEAFRRSIPMIVCYAIVGVLNKQAMDHSGFHEGVYAYACLQAGAVFFLGLPFIVRRRLKEEKAVLSGRLLRASVFVAFAISFHLITKNYAYSLVDDPTFPTAILLTSPVFILLFYALTKHKEEVDVWSGLGVVFSVIALAVIKGL